MESSTARNLAVLLENQTRAMSRMTEAQLSSTFNGYSPENMLRLIRLSYPNSVRGQLFTEFSMETAHDSIKYVYPVYAASDPDGKAGRYEAGDVDKPYNMAGRMDRGELGDIMIESPESQFATEFMTVETTSGEVDLTTAEPFKSLGYIDGYSKFIVDGKVVAVQFSESHKNVWFYAEPGASVEKTANGFKLTGVTGTKIEFVGAYNSERDLGGKYLGEVELIMKDYHFQPRPISLGVTWTQLTELVLDTSFGISAEEMLMDSAAQEIKKTLDFQAIKYANAVQKTNGLTTVTFQAEAPGAAEITTKDSYWHTAQIIEQAIDQVSNAMYDKILRGGVSAIVGGPKAVTYLKLNNAWKDTGKQPAIGAYKVGELGGIPVFKVPSSIIPEDELLTTWKNDNAEGDVSIAIGTLMPFFSTGAIQRKNFYKEAGLARYEDTKALQPGYLGRIKIEGIR